MTMVQEILMQRRNDHLNNGHYFLVVDTVACANACMGLVVGAMEVVVVPVASFLGYVP